MHTNRVQALLDRMLEQGERDRMRDEWRWSSVHAVVREFGQPTVFEQKLEHSGALSAALDSRVGVRMLQFECLHGLVVDVVAFDD